MVSDEPDAVSSGRVRELLDEYSREAVQLRMGAELPRHDSAPSDVLHCLLDVRQRLDRVEELLATSLRLRGVATRQLTACRIIADDAWDEAAVAARQSGVRDEYSSAKERTAVANLEVIDLRRAERKADEIARVCTETVEFLRLRYNGLAGVRQDLLAWLRSVQFESTLDR